MQIHIDRNEILILLTYIYCSLEDRMYPCQDSTNVCQTAFQDIANIMTLGLDVKG